jgi:hypothetical protein
MNGKGIPLDTMIAAANTHDSRYCGARWSGCTGSGSISRRTSPSIWTTTTTNRTKRDM